MDYKITYSPDPSRPELFTTYSDADYGGNPDNGRSTSGVSVIMASGAISWMSHLQSIVTLSTTEAEYIAAVLAGQEISWLHNLFLELGFESKSPSILNIDNNSAIAVAKDPQHHGWMKHLDLCHYWLRDTVESGIIAVTHIPGTDNPVDVLTKPLGRLKFKEFTGQLGLG